jgi:hypothetical protein
MISEIEAVLEKSRRASKILDEEPHAHEFLENLYRTGAAPFVEGLLTFSPPYLLSFFPFG